MSSSNSLEERIDWKQWIPIYGVYRAYQDFFQGKPSIVGRIRENSDSQRTSNNLFYGSAVYHSVVALSSLAALGVGLFYLIRQD